MVKGVLKSVIILIFTLSVIVTNAEISSSLRKLNTYLCSDPNCYLCSDNDPNYCFSCSDGYASNGYTKCLESCFYFSNCSSCSSYTCYKCYDGYILSGTSCIENGCYTSGCSNCNPFSPEWCELCSTGYYTSNGKCMKFCNDEFCTDCSDVDNAQRYTLINGVCTFYECPISNCKTCNLQLEGTCADCREGYELENSFCVEKPKNKNKNNGVIIGAVVGVGLTVLVIGVGVAILCAIGKSRLKDGLSARKITARSDFNMNQPNVNNNPNSGGYSSQNQGYNQNLNNAPANVQQNPNN